MVPRMAFGAGNPDPLAPVREGEPGPLYLLYGKERFLVDRGVELLRQRVLDPRTKDFNAELFHGKDGDPARIVQAARTLPMMAKRRFVLVRDIDEMKADAMSQLVPYVQAAAKETCLVLTAEKVDQRLKLFTAWKKHGVMVKLDPLYERQLPAFVREEARARNVKLEAGAAELLSDEIGADLGQLADALERLGIFVGDRPVSVRDVEEVVATTRQRTIFELADACGSGDRSRALTILGAIIGARESGVRVVAMLARHVRQLWSAHDLMQKGRPNKFDLAQALGIPPFFVEGIMNQARRLDPPRLSRMHDALFRADKMLKSSRLEDARLLEKLVLDMTG
jgi:DNA polymerase III subunit delta